MVTAKHPVMHTLCSVSIAGDRVRVVLSTRMLPIMFGIGATDPLYFSGDFESAARLGLIVNDVPTPDMIGTLGRITQALFACCGKGCWVRY
jgi:hypothetical protein